MLCVFALHFSHRYVHALSLGWRSAASYFPPHSTQDGSDFREVCVCALRRSALQRALYERLLPPSAKQQQPERGLRRRAHYHSGLGATVLQRGFRCGQEEQRSDAAHGARAGRKPIQLISLTMSSLFVIPSHIVAYHDIYWCKG